MPSADDERHKIILTVFLTATIAIAITTFSKESVEDKKSDFVYFSPYACLLYFFIADRFRYLIGDISVSFELKKHVVNNSSNQINMNSDSNNGFINKADCFIEMVQFIFDVGTFICFIMAGIFITNWIYYFVFYALAYSLATFTLNLPPLVGQKKGVLKVGI
ncbi:MAG TPA: hypothetical protein PK745_14955, partial [bacterium]|nr:hypothetical protein [bacterium]